MGRSQDARVHFLLILLGFASLSGIYSRYYRCVVRRVYFYIARVRFYGYPSERRVVLSSVEPVYASEHRVAEPSESCVRVSV